MKKWDGEGGAVGWVCGRGGGWVGWVGKGGGVVVWGDGG